MNKSKLENLKDIQDWAALYDDFYVFKNNEHNIHFWQVTKVKNFKEAEKLLKRNFNWKDISRGMKYIDWWDKDCKNAAMSGNKPVDWMKERLMKDKLAPEYFGNKESYTQKDSMQSKTFSCIKCGAEIISNSNPILVCEYCGSELRVGSK